MELAEFDMTQLRLLASLAGTESLSDAAIAIGITQSAASHALRKLRRQTGDRLFVRSGRGFKPTYFGAKLTAAARTAIGMLIDGLTTPTVFDPKSSTRNFNVYLNELGQLAFLEPLMDHLAVEAPNVSLKVHHVPLKQSYDALASGEVDLAVGFFDSLKSGFLCSLLYQTRYVLIAREDHPLFLVGMTMDAFASAAHAVADPSGMAHGLVEQHLLRSNVKRFVRLRLPDFILLPLLVAGSDLVAIVPEGLARTFAARLPLQLLDPPITLPPFDLMVYWNERFDQDPANVWLRQTFIKLFRCPTRELRWVRRRASA